MPINIGAKEYLLAIYEQNVQIMPTQLNEKKFERG
jgi:hypothetical protein